MNFLVPICREEEGKRNCICPDESHALCRESSAAFWDSNNNYHHSRYSKQVKCATEDMGGRTNPRFPISQAAVYFFKSVDQFYKCIIDE
jgi:hypothetical protein